MAGAYCNFCDRRCFVYRIVPDGPEKGWGGHMATCQGGMAHDLKETGHTHLTAVNPVTEPDAAEAVAAEVAGERGREAARLAVETAEFALFASQVDAMFPDPAQAPGVDRMTGADWLYITRVLRDDRAGVYRLVRYWWDKAGSTLSRGPLSRRQG